MTDSPLDTSGAGIVAIIDTGVDVGHPVLEPVLVPAGTSRATGRAVGDGGCRSADLPRASTTPSPPT